MLPTTKIASFALVTLAFTSSWVAAVPLRAGSHIQSSRDIGLPAPQILTPTFVQTLIAAQRFNFTWEPKTRTNIATNIQLGRANFSSGQLSEDVPLRQMANEFSVVDGTHEIVIPGDLETRTDYMFGMFPTDGKSFTPSFSPAFAIVSPLNFTVTSPKE